MNKKFKTMSKTLCTILVTILVAPILSNGVQAKAIATEYAPVLGVATQQIGKNYVYGATGPNTFDCSGLTSYVYRNALGIEIGRSTYDQKNVGIGVSYENLKPGDLVFPHDGHVMLYAGNGEVIEAPRTGLQVRRVPLTRDRFAYARRIIGYSEIEDSMFNAEYYAYRYADLRDSFGLDKDKLYYHYITCGIKEGRSASPIFDPQYYLQNNADLKSAFGNNYVAAYNHFVTNGHLEARKSSAVFDMAVYKSSKNPDLMNMGNLTLYKHFLSNGINEGRIASNEFNVQIYRSKYSDLRNALGNNLRYYYYHYMTYGIREGRTATEPIIYYKNK